MFSRRHFVVLVGAGLAAGSSRLLGMQGRAAKPRYSVPIGLQLYSLRNEFKKDVPGTLAFIHQLGFTEIEGGGTYGMSLPEFKKLLEKNELKCTAYGAGYEELQKNLPEVAQSALAFGASYIMCAWIPHDKEFTRKNCEQAIADFNQWGKEFKKQGLHFTYHIHGYEFVPSPEGTLFDLMARKLEPGVADFEMDVFWVAWPGQDPVALLRKYPGRFPLIHLKDLRKGAKGDQTGHAPDEFSVPLGMGMIDFPTIFREGKKLGIKRYYIEDEVPEAAQNLPKSLSYLDSLHL